jgi:hypothetical protein
MSFLFDRDEKGFNIDLSSWATLEMDRKIRIIF